MPEPPRPPSAWTSGPMSSKAATGLAVDRGDAVALGQHAVGRAVLGDIADHRRQQPEARGQADDLNGAWLVELGGQLRQVQRGG